MRPGVAGAGAACCAPTGSCYCKSALTERARLLWRWDVFGCLPHARGSQKSRRDAGATKGGPGQIAERKGVAGAGAACCAPTETCYCKTGRPAGRRYKWETRRRSEATLNRGSQESRPDVGATRGGPGQTGVRPGVAGAGAACCAPTGSCYCKSGASATLRTSCGCEGDEVPRGITRENQE